MFSSLCLHKVPTTTTIWGGTLSEGLRARERTLSPSPHTEKQQGPEFGTEEKALDGDPALARFKALVQNSRQQMTLTLTV